MLMTLSIIQPSLTLNHACKSKNMPVALYTHTHINLCVCPGGSWICFEVSLSEVRLNLYQLQSLNLFCMFQSNRRSPCREDWEPENCPSVPLLPATSLPRPVTWWLERMCRTFSLRVSVSVCVSKNWPGFRGAESHRLGSPKDGQGLA